MAQRNEMDCMWTIRETNYLLELVSLHDGDWELIAPHIPGKTPEACNSWVNFIDSASQFLTKRKKKVQQMNQPRKRRKANQVERLYKCLEKFCNRSYGSEGALKMHIKIKHPGVSYNEVYLVQARKAAATLSQLGMTEQDVEEDSETTELAASNGGLPNESLSNSTQLSYEYSQEPPTQLQEFDVHQPYANHIPVCCPNQNSSQNHTHQYVPINHSLPNPVGELQAPVLPQPPLPSVPHNFIPPDSRKPTKRSFFSSDIAEQPLHQQLQMPASTADVMPTSKRFKTTLPSGAFFRFETRGSPNVTPFHFVRNPSAPEPLETVPTSIQQFRR